MQTNLLYRPSQTLAQIRLAPGESVVAEQGAMVGMTTNVAMQAQAGGLVGGLKRLFGGETLIRNTFTAQGGEGEVLFATPLSGDLALVDVGTKQWFVQNTSFVASSPTVQAEPKSGGFRGFFSGAGFFLLKTTGAGQMIIGAFGAIEALQVEDGLLIDPGHVLAWESSLTYTMKDGSKGLIASWLSGEGLVCSFEGKGTIYMQSRNAAEYGKAVGSMLPGRL